jgi:DNA-binding NtrC family response regulator
MSFAHNEEEGLSLLESGRVDVLVAGLDRGGMGYEFVRQAASIHPLLGVVLLAGTAAVEDAPQPMHRRQVQVLQKPITQDLLRSAIRRALEGKKEPGPARGDAEKMPALAHDHSVEGLNGTGQIIAASKAMREILELVRRCALTDVPVLVSGEPDTGKQSIAREIHRQSRRAAGPFVRVACDVLRESELAGKLFGSPERELEPESQTPFTLLEAAQGGTLFLENVSELPLWGQVKLLDVLQHGRTLGAGSRESATVDVRVIASTTANLQTAAAQRAFLSSLYYYLNVVQIDVPPLRYRREDISALAEHLLATAVSMFFPPRNQLPWRFSEEAGESLLRYDWPGNAVQLSAVVAHAAMLAEGPEIGQACVAGLLGSVRPHADDEAISVPLAGGLKEMELVLINEVIRRCRGNKAAAARALGLHRRTLYRILQDGTHGERDAGPLPLILGPSIGDHGANLHV